MAAGVCSRSEMLRFMRSTRVFDQALRSMRLLPCKAATTSLPVPHVCMKRTMHTTRVSHGLMEFFDDPENWGQREVETGRPWTKSELRMKSNADLHKLWYVCLKEMNMLLTMQNFYRKEYREPMPSPERIEKVEQTLDSIWDIVEERNETKRLLELGKPSPDSVLYVTKDALGRRVWKQPTEHLVPKYASKSHHEKMSLLKGGWEIPYLRMEGEKRMKERSQDEKKQYRFNKRRARMFDRDKYKVSKFEIEPGFYGEEEKEEEI